MKPASIVKYQQIYTYLSIVIAVLYLFFLPMRSEILQRIISVSLLLMTLTFVCLNIIKISVKKIFAISILVCIFMLSRLMVFRIPVFLICLLVSYFIYTIDLLPINKYFLFLIIISSFVAVICQMFYFRYDGRPVLNINDPNYSSLYIFLLFLLAFKFGYRCIAYLIALIGCFTLSRNYILAISIFLLLTKMPLLTNLLIKLKLTNFTSIFIVGTFGVLVVGNIFLKEKVVEISENKFSSLRDRSNEARFTANLFFLNDITKYPQTYLFGKGHATYLDETFHLITHNHFFQLFIEYGILLVLIYFSIFGGIINNAFKNCCNIPYIFSILTYLSLLGGLMGPDLILFTFILKFKKHENFSRYSSTQQCIAN